MTKTLFLFTVFLSVSAYAQRSEPAADSAALNTQLAENSKLELLKSKPGSFTASSLALLDESGQQVNVITPEMLEDMKRSGKVPTIRIGNVTFVVQAPIDQRLQYAGPQE